MMWKSILGAILLLISLLACHELLPELVPPDDPPVENPDPPGEGIKITLGDVEAGDRFGFAVDATDRHLAVGAYGDDKLGQDAGVVYVLNREGLTFEPIAANIRASDGKKDDEFGYTLAIEGNILIVGAPKQDPNGENSGAVYVFQYEGSEWKEIRKLTPKDPNEDERFGWSVDMSGDYAIIGQYHDRESWDPDKLYTGNAQGTAYIFDIRTWEEVAKLSPNEGIGHRFDGFGQAVTVSGDWAVVGAKGNSGPQYDEPGHVYLYHREGGTWMFEARLYPEDPINNDFFGSTVAIDGDYLAVGAPNAFNSLLPSLNPGPGAAYVFKWDGNSWAQRGKLFGNDTQPDDDFGTTVGIHHQTVIVGAPLATVSTRYNGAAYMFHSSGNQWTEIDKLVESDPLNEDLFGGAISIVDDAIFIGASRRCNQTGCWAGAVYAFKR